MTGQTAIIGGDTMRARAYVSMLAAAAVPISSVLLLPPVPGSTGRELQATRFDASFPVAEQAKAAGIAVRHLPSSDINAPEVVASVAAAPEDVLVYAGYPGVLLGRELLATGKRFLHVHPGWLPDFRGSTTMYYSVLTGGEVGASALFLTAGIDEGPVLARRRYPLPSDRIELDGEYDAWVRADLLVRVLADFTATGRFDEDPQRRDAGNTYYVIHPVLKHIALLGKEP